MPARDKIDGFASARHMKGGLRSNRNKTTRNSMNPQIVVKALKEEDDSDSEMSQQTQQT